MIRAALAFAAGFCACLASILGIDWWIMRQHQDNPWRWR